MHWLKSILGTSIGKKWLVALTGLGLVGFVLVHLSGNLLIYAGAEAFNAYAHALHSQPILPLLEIGLAGCFILHILLTYSLYLDNRKKRGPKQYAVQQTKQTTWKAIFSNNTALSGTVVLLFLVMHLSQFRFEAVMRGPALETPFDKTIRLLSDPLTAVVYIAGTLLLAGHLSHGIQSLFRTVGFYHARLTPVIETGAIWLGFAIGIGFASLPVYVLLTY